MGFLRDLITLAKETPDERRKRESQGRVVTKTRPHVDDHYGFDGMNKWSEERKKKAKKSK